MPLATGTSLGRYEVLSPLGAGGMGEVYRAHDPQLGRDVAIKVIGGDAAASPERLSRFEQEARAVAALQHAHVLAVHDVGSHDGQPYVVFELLEGETLRERLAHGAIAPRKAIEIATQMCDGLAAAHARGVIHRDLKPENVFLAREGGVKLLDFGLAKLLEGDGDGASEARTATATDRGRWVGTPGYVSPEQVRGQGATARSDVFGLGAVLYEMLTGQRAFRGATKADTLAAILDKDPAPMSVSGGTTPLPLERIILRCLEKEPDDRFQSARDVAFALEALSSGSMSETAAAVASARPLRRWWWLAAAAAAVAAGTTIGFLGGRRAAEKPPPTFKQLTFRRGWLDLARFAPDGRTVFYGASWDGKPVELFQTRTDSTESRPLGLPHAKVLSISSQGQMAILLDPKRQQGWFNLGTLAVVPLAGGTPRELLENVLAADWTPDGRDLCVARMAPNGEIAIELPPGTAVDWIPRIRVGIGFFRLSPDGRYIAYRDLGVRKLRLADRERKVVTDVAGYADYAWGMAWERSSRELWLTEGDNFASRDVFAVDLEGRRRLIYRSAGVLSLVDVAPDGRALLHRGVDRNAALALLPGEKVERDVTVYDSSVLGSISNDGRLLLVNAYCGGAGPGWCTYLRRDGGDPVRVAAGRGLDLSPDGTSALVLTDAPELLVVPIGAGLARRVDLGALRELTGAAFVPGSPRAVIVRGRARPEDGFRLWLEEDGSKPRDLGVAVLPAFAISLDGRSVGASTAIDTISVTPLTGGPRRDLRVPRWNLGVSRWSADGRSLFLSLAEGWPCEIHRLDLTTEKLELWRRAAPPDPAGMISCDGMMPSSDGRSYVYTVNPVLSSLIVAEGLR